MRDLLQNPLAKHRDGGLWKEAEGLPGHWGRLLAPRVPAPEPRFSWPPLQRPAVFRFPEESPKSH